MVSSKVAEQSGILSIRHSPEKKSDMFDVGMEICMLMSLITPNTNLQSMMNAKLSQQRF